jgi:hypothetical protein
VSYKIGDKIITHKNIRPYLDRLQREPEFKIGCNGYRPTGDEWYRQRVKLQFPTGEIARDGLTTMALVGRNAYTTEGLDGKEGFNAQGLEGRVTVHKDLFSALMNLRDLLKPGRGRIVLEK